MFAYRYTKSVPNFRLNEVQTLIFSCMFIHHIPTYLICSLAHKAIWRCYLCRIQSTVNGAQLKITVYMYVSDKIVIRCNLHVARATPCNVKWRVIFKEMNRVI